MQYQIKFLNQAKKFLKTLDQEKREYIHTVLVRYSFDPLKYAKKVRGGDYRFRIGQYRAIFRIYHNVLLVEVVKIGQRQNVYEGN